LACRAEIAVRRWQAAASCRSAPCARPIEGDADAIADETPVALVYNGISHVVMMMTPADLEDFAVGFSLSEGIIERATELRDIEVHAREHGLELAITLPPARESVLKEMRRNLTGRTGCGLCGAESLEQAIRAVAPVPRGLVIEARAIDAAVAALPRSQPLAQATGGTHGAAWCARDGSILAAREDVGRHNALDKLIGALARAGTALDEGFALVSSRASYEMVTKAARAGVQLLAAVSAPTTLAVRLAEEAGLSLVAFARPGRLSIYSAADRIDCGQAGGGAHRW
jgi:formate dehydrogenase accessory protein FdhD